MVKLKNLNITWPHVPCHRVESVLQSLQRGHILSYCTVSSAGYKLWSRTVKERFKLKIIKQKPASCSLIRSASCIKDNMKR